jgi:hypothetical protein
MARDSPLNIADRIMYYAFILSHPGRSVRKGQEESSETHESLSQRLVGRHSLAGSSGRWVSHRREFIRIAFVKFHMVILN